MKHRNEALGTLARARDAPDLAGRLNSANVHLNRALRDERGTGLAAEHRSALSVVAFMGPIAIGDLARAERVGAPAMTKTVKVLEAAGLVRRDADPTDGRRVWVSATAAGAAMVRRGRDERVTKIRKAIAALAPGDRKRLAAGVKALELVVTTIGSAAERDRSASRRSTRNRRAGVGGRTASKG